MHIVMMTNTFFPHVGGVARSVVGFTEALRRAGHRVLVVAPEFPHTPDEEQDVIRIPAIQRFNGSDFSVSLPVPGLLDEPLDGFRPDVIHTHHPFFMGDTAMRVASERRIPLVFTHHTLYEQYTHYVSGQSEALKRFVVDLTVGYANLCDHVVAPSRSIAELLHRRHVTAPISVVPTGLDLSRFSRGDGAAFRRAHGIPEGAFVAGHVGRLAPEKNLIFLVKALADFLRGNPEDFALIVGKGPLEGEMQEMLRKEGIEKRSLFLGILEGDALAGAYGAMDVFAFASHSETQGMVLAEAMACGVPVVGIDASGVREMIRDGENGRLLAREDREEFSSALEWLARRSPDERKRLREKALETAREYSMERSLEKLLAVYEAAVRRRRAAWVLTEDNPWSQARRRIQAEWKLFSNIAHAAGTALSGTDPEASAAA